MRWGDPLLSILLNLHYTASYAVGQFTHSGSHFNFNKNGNNSRGGSHYNSFSFVQHPNFSGNANTDASVNCVNNSNLCHTAYYWQNYDKYQRYPSFVNYTPKFQSLLLQQSLSGGYYNNFGWGNNGYRFKEYKNANPLQHQPVYYYVDPLRNREDKGDDSESHADGSHAATPDGGHNSHDHQAIQPHGGHGGWAKPQEYHHYKNKKKHKGKFAKLIKKFKPHHKPQKLIWKEVPECNGFENFIKDLEIISWITGWTGLAFATVGYILHILNQIYESISIFLVGFPERLLTFIELQNPGSTPEGLRTFLEIVGLIDYVFNLFVSYPTGFLIVKVETVAQILTLASLSLATITVFDDIVLDKVWAIFGIDLEELFEGYGCDNPFSKEKKIEQFIENFSKW